LLIESLDVFVWHTFDVLGGVNRFAHIAHFLMNIRAGNSLYRALVLFDANLADAVQRIVLKRINFKRIANVLGSRRVYRNPALIYYWPKIPNGLVKLCACDVLLLDCNIIIDWPGLALGTYDLTWIGRHRVVALTANNDRIWVRDWNDFRRLVQFNTYLI
jgi:hypothetical protein